MPYIANTDQDRTTMLGLIGAKDIQDLWSQAGVKLDQPLLEGVPEGKSEFEVYQYLAKLAGKNADDLICFLGGGFYDHFIPSAVSEITGRTEFYTSYTPYQPEVSQGTLQAMFEYQSAICRVTGMEVSNASLYDGGTALFEAIMMSVRITRKRKAVLAGTVSPIYREMIQCYSSNLDIDLSISENDDTQTNTNVQKLCELIDDDTSCVIVQYPNFFGTIEDWSELIEYAKKHKVLTICSTYPIALSLLQPPGDLGFDIITGEGQCLGINLSFGGPYVGFMASRNKYLRQMPGRIIGRTKDSNGKDGFVLTIQTREQHIKRERATSNICTNQGLCALAAVVYLSCIGKDGFVKLGELCNQKAYFAKAQLLAITGVTDAGQSDFFNEFVIRLPIDAAEVVGKLIDKGYAAGFPLSRYFPDRKNDLLVAVTEKRTREEISSFAVAMEAILADS